MKRIHFLLITLGFVLLLSTNSWAQNDLRIPLSKPNQPGVLKLNAVFADEIIVRAHVGNDVRILIDGEDKEIEENLNRNGLRRISNGGAGLEVSESNNEVNIKTSPHNGDVELEILVPSKFSLFLQVTHGDVLVEGIEGEHEVRATNGDVEMLGVSGSAIVNSINGDIEVEFVRVSPNTPMSFNGLNGDIEVSFPAGTKFSGKMKTDFGDVYTNFDIEIDRSSSSNQVTQKDGTYSVTLNKWITGKVNGGGPEFLFKTLHGDIEIRKN